MTRARIASYGPGTPPPLDRWIEAVLMLCVSLVQGVAATFGMRRWIRQRDWHTPSETFALPQTKRDIHIKDLTTPTESRSGLTRESLLENPKGLADSPSEALNQESRHKVENGAVDVATPKPVIPAEARQRVELETRSHAHRRLHMQPLGSGSR